VRISRKSRLEVKKTSFSKETTKKHPTLKELQEKKHPFLESDLLGMLDDLLENMTIKLPEPKRHRRGWKNKQPEVLSLSWGH